MRDRSSARRAGTVLLYLGLGAASALLWARVVESYRLPSWHTEIICARAPSPNQYRVLTPWIAHLLLPLVSTWAAFPYIAAYFAVRAAATGLALLLFDRYLRTWFAPAAAAAGALALAAIIPFTYYPAVQESDPINLLVLIAAFWALANNRDALLFPLVLVGTLNRETTFLVPLAYLLARFGTQPAKRVALRTAGLAGCWVGAYGGLLVSYGVHRGYTSTVKVFENLASWVPTTFALLFFGVLWVLPFLALKLKPPTLLQRAIWLLPPFVALQYLVGVVQEVRLFLPLAPIVIPLAWWVLFPEAANQARPPGTRGRRTSPG